jgi:hypothetical protein
MLHFVKAVFSNQPDIYLSMKTFQSFLEDRKVVEQSMFKDFIKQHGLQDYYKDFKTNHPSKQVVAPPDEAKGWELAGDEAVRTITGILKSCIEHMPKVNRFGIDDIYAEVISKQEVSNGTQMTLEVTGVAAARDEDHINAHLKKLMEVAKPQLAQKGIHAEVLYNRLDISQEVDEMAQDEPQVGLVHKYKFTVLMVAIVSGMKGG